MIDQSSFLDAVSAMAIRKSLEEHELFETINDDDFFKFRYGFMREGKECFMASRSVAKEALLNAEAGMIDYLVRCVSRVIDQGRKMAEAYNEQGY